MSGVVITFTAAAQAEVAAMARALRVYAYEKLRRAGLNALAALRIMYGPRPLPVVQEIIEGIGRGDRDAIEKFTRAVIRKIGVEVQP